jgi:hypothetical protein
MLIESLQIILLGLLATVGYGIVHDQVTVRLCLEYFTIGHPRRFRTTSPTLLALGWGILATWWVGLPLSIVLALVAQLGHPPRLDAAALLIPIGILIGSTACAATVAGLVGAFCAAHKWVWLVPPLAHRVPRYQHVRFLAALWAHLTSYGIGILGGIIVIGWVCYQRSA